MAGPWIGVDIGGTKMLCVAHWPAGRQDEVLRLATGSEAWDKGIEHYIERFVGSLGEKPQGIGIAIPGLVEDGRVVACDVLPQLDGWSPSIAFGDAPMVVINDVRAALVRELDAQAGGTIAVIVAGTGIGMALASNGQVVEGARGWAGELGSIPLFTPNGIVKLDAVASGAAIVARCGRDPEAIHRALAAGEADVRRIMRDAAAAFGLALATVVDIFNPSVVALGGGTLSYDGYVDAAVAVAAEQALPPLWKACTIVNRGDDPLYVALGAARAAELAAEERR